MFISFTSSSSSRDASTARVWTEFLNCCFYCSIYEGGRFFFFSSSNLNICSFFAFARASLCYFYSSASFFYNASSYLVGFLIVSYMILLLPWFFECPLAWVLQVIYDYNSFISPFGLLSLIIPHFFVGNWFLCLCYEGIYRTNSRQFMISLRHTLTLMICFLSIMMFSKYSSMLTFISMT